MEINMQIMELQSKNGFSFCWCPKYLKKIDIGAEVSFTFKEYIDRFLS